MDSRLGCVRPKTKKPTTGGNQRPHSFNDTERPGAGEPAIQRGRGARQREDEYPGDGTVFKSIRQQHDSDRTRTEQCQW
jgi:hypothetical protein